MTLIIRMNSKENTEKYLQKIKLSLLCCWISAGEWVSRDLNKVCSVKSHFLFIIWCYCTLLIALRRFDHRREGFYLMNPFFLHHEDVWFSCEG
jgi:hypothetical protein